MFTRKKKQGERLNTDGTMKWRKKTSENKKQKSLRETVMRARSTRGSLDTSDMLGACEIPCDFDVSCQDDINSWLAENTVEFFNEAYLNYSMASDNNAEWEETCRNPKLHPSKGYPEGVKYFWREPGKPKPVELPADEYISRLFFWIEQKIDDEEVFPPEEDTPFPPTFRTVLRKIFHRLFRVYVFIYSNECLLEPLKGSTLQTSLSFFLYFGWHWELLEFEDNQESRSINKILAPIREKYLRDKARNDKRSNSKQIGTMRSGQTGTVEEVETN